MEDSTGEKQVEEGRKGAPVDIDKVLSRFEDDLNFFKEMFSSLLQYIPDLILKVRNATMDGNAETVTITGHNIKGAAATMGATRISSLGAEIESRGREGNLSGIPDILRELETELEVLKEYYKTL